MKKFRIILALLLLMGCGFTGMSQSAISVSYGAFPTMNYFSGYRGGYDFRHAWGTVNVAIEHNFFTPRLMLGVNYSFSSSPGVQAGTLGAGADVSAAWHTLMTSARYSYWQRGRLTVYGRLGVGVNIGYFTPSWTDSYNITRFAFQLSPICLDYRIAGVLSGFMECGMGNEGIVQVGARVTL